MVLGIAFALPFLPLNAGAREIGLGTASYDAVLAGFTITSPDPAIINEGPAFVLDSAMTGGSIANWLYEAGDAPALLAQDDFTTAELRWRTKPLPHHPPVVPGLSVPDTGSTLMLLAFALAAIFAFKRPSSTLPSKADFIKSTVG